MSTNEFYAILPSNASMETFPDNTLHSFKIKIPSLLPSDYEKWNVGLAEIQFPSSWRNIINGFVTIRYDKNSYPISFSLYDGMYGSIPDVIAAINKILSNEKLNTSIALTYNEIRNKVTLSIRDQRQDFGIAFSQNILNILGLTKNKEEFFTLGTYTENPADIYEGFSALYVYANVVENRIVGDARVPLLRVVPIEKRVRPDKGVQWVRFNHIQYVPVVNRNSDTIEINIRRDNGQIVPFDSGKVVLTLHFKKQS